MRRWGVSARTRRMCGHAITSRLFPRIQPTETAAKMSPAREGRWVAWRGFPNCFHDKDSSYLMPEKVSSQSVFAAEHVAMRAAGYEVHATLRGILHRLVCCRANRMQFAYAYFFRNRPELGDWWRLRASRQKKSRLADAVCSCFPAERGRLSSHGRRAPEFISRTSKNPKT